ncbi:tRNA (adenosine(37)-N6)-threonylcarbamoyltransferase complex ATPase subunit type 1 TsaE [Chlamydia sp. 17-3921]|uniref:tRNA (adenosine(37)-N6)-threonylcarbamoyltransferase complex ATPase subunit type 1 TsaE n=1 Tax=Chlamydia sp. 17-3921 TaxID=2675798 RepID=UPI001919875A|nr:tRNA (adenosine(37)-N6)-threonylcarbamoyltransferase complex ATPase subunit type 1 TsaE [Chlamydia sp. 17-3921]
MGGYRRVTNSSIETVMFGAWLGKRLSPGMVLLLFGDYGAGKTEFVRGVVQGFLGSTFAKDVASPSFSLLHVYESSSRRVCHYDFYRLDKECLMSIFQDTEEDDVICIEWADRIQTPQFRDSIRIYIETLMLEQREVRIDAPKALLS